MLRAAMSRSDSACHMTFPSIALWLYSKNGLASVIGSPFSVKGGQLTTVHGMSRGLHVSTARLCWNRGRGVDPKLAHSARSCS
jgi:hypothetical protein